MRFLEIRKIPPLPGILLLLGLAISVPAPAQAYVTASVSFSTFDGALSPYGTWVTLGRYGRCWRPSRVSVGWQPYSNGEWLYTDYGWSWVSYDPWGAYPYHYGSWVYEPGYGWVWVPGYVWGPAWVTWCWGDGFIGWAPLSPGFVFTASGYFGGAVVDPASSYVFVPPSRLVGVNASTARFSPARNATFLRTGRTLTRFSTSGGVVRTLGPDPKRIEGLTHRAIRPTSIAAAKLHPVRIDAGRARGSRISLTSRANPGPSARTMARSHPTRSAPPRRASSTATGRRVSAPAHAAPKRVVARSRPAAHPKAAITARRSVEPRKPAVPKTRVATTYRRPVAPERTVKTVERPKALARPSPVVTRERPVVQAAPRVQAHAAPAPRVESRPPAAPRMEARHAPPTPRTAKKESGR